MVVSEEFRDTPWKHYDYLTDIQLQKGDLAVVPAGPPEAERFAVVKVVDLKKESSRATAWVVQKVDVKGFQKKMKQRSEDMEIEAMFS